jgi:hypothetical protein
VEFRFRTQTGSVSLHDDMVTFVKLPTLDPEKKIWPHNTNSIFSMTGALMGKSVHIFRTDNIQHFFLIADKSQLTTVLDAKRKYSWQQEHPYRSSEHNALHCENSVKINYKLALIFHRSGTMLNSRHVSRGSTCSSFIIRQVCMFRQVRLVLYYFFVSYNKDGLRLD